MRPMGLLTRTFFALSSLGLASLSGAKIPVTYEWSGYGGNSQHTALSPVGINTASAVLWHFPIDTDPVYSGSELLIHYGEPCVTPEQNLVVPQRQNDGSYKICGLNPLVPLHPFVYPYYTYAVVWSVQSSYAFPPHNWTPSMGPTLLPGTMAIGGSGSGGITSLISSTSSGGNAAVASPQVAWPESGGRIAIRNSADTQGGTVNYHAFYGDANYALSSATFDASIQICTPLTAGPDGSLYFGYYSTGNNPLGITSGLAVIHPNGLGSYVTAATMSGGDGTIDRVAFNAAPTITTDNKRVYVVVSAGYSGKGYLVQLNPQNLLTRTRIALLDPKNHLAASVTCDSTASPMIAPDGSVFYGVLENSLGSNNYRGWMLHYDANLLKTYPPGGFGWDDTASIVPSSMITGYLGGSPFLICTKYNNYYEAGGDGVNQVAILDPYNTNGYNGVNAMAPVKTVVGPTPDPAGVGAGYPNAVKEWCINSACVDSFDKLIILNSEDGNAYVWDPNNASTPLKYTYPLTAGIGEAYTPTAIGYGQSMLAISNASLYYITPY